MSLLAAARPTFIGQVATRCYCPATIDANALTWMARTFHFLRSFGGVTAIKVAFPNWYVVNNASSGPETGSGGTSTIKAGLEYPAGTFRQFLFGGATSKTVVTKATLWTDWLPVGIPDGAKFFIRHQRANPTAVVFNDDTFGSHVDVAQGDAVEQTSTDKTISGTVTDGGNGIAMYPAAIIARTSSGSIFLPGDSRIAGLTDTTVGTSGDQGEIARTIGPKFAYINCGVAGTSITDWVTGTALSSGAALRKALSQYCTTVIGNYGINDITFDGTSSATMQARVASLAAIFAPKPYYHCTLPPITTGAWTNPAGSDQTLGTNNTVRAAFNTALRAMSIPGVAGFNEIASIMESGSTGKWNAPGFTTDGIHETTTALLTIALLTERFNLRSTVGMPQFGP